MIVIYKKCNTTFKNKKKEKDYMHLICVIIPVLVIFIISYEHLDNETIND